MLRIGITGQSGFIGTHLFETLGLCRQDFERIPFEDSFFSDAARLKEFAGQCDVIVHLAAVNRHHDPGELYRTNIRLVEQLISACETADARPHMIFSSSTQEERENNYSLSKRHGRELLEQWAVRNQARFTGLIIPNVFGPFGNPYYNSVVATFCHQLSHNEIPVVESDTELRLIYAGELVSEIIRLIRTAEGREPGIERIVVANTATIRVSELLRKLNCFKENYFDNGIIPELSGPFDCNLFNTFLCYLPLENFYPYRLKQVRDDRGSFVEIMKLKSGGQISFSTTLPGITRGNHFHTRKAERFAVIRGMARIDLRRIGTGKVISFELNGENPSFVDMPVWHTHSITNIGDGELFTIFWINEFYNQDDPDTWHELVRQKPAE